MAKGSTNVSDYRFSIFINNDQAKQSVIEMEKVVKQYEDSLKQLERSGKSKDSSEWKEMKAKLDDANKSMMNLKKEAGLTSLSMKELKGLFMSLSNELNRAVPGTSAFKQIEKEMEAVKKRMNDIKGVSSQVSGELGGKGIMGTILGVAGGISLSDMFTKATSAVKDFFKEGIKSAIELRDSEKLLLDVLDGNKVKQQELINLAKDRAGSTKYTRLEIEEEEKFLVIQGRSQEQIKKTMEAAENLATVTGRTLKEAVMDLDGTMEGRMGKSLGKLEKDFRQLSKEQMYNGAAIDIVRQKYAGLAEEEMNTTEGKIILLEKSWKALRRTIGDFAIGSSGIFTDAIEGATSFLNTIKKWFEVPVSQKLQEEADKVNILASQLMEANIPAETRNKLYNELKTIAPDVVAGLDSENISYQKLTSNLNAYNNEMVNKIILQKEDEKIEDSNANLANARMKRIEQEGYIRIKTIEQINRLSDDMTKQSGKAYERSKKQIDDLKAILYNPNLEMRQKAPLLQNVYPQLFGSLNEYQMLLEAENKAMAETNLTAKAKIQLMKDLGIEEKKISSFTGPPVPAGSVSTDKGTVVPDPTGGLIPKEYMVKKSLDELNEIISKARDENASNVDRTNARVAQAVIDNNERLREADNKKNESALESYKNLMSSIKEISETNFAEKLNETQREIKRVQDEYDTKIKAVKKFQEDKEKYGRLTPEQKKEVDASIPAMELERDKQTKQVLEQAEKDFADKVTQIHENLRVARMSITEREVHEINKKYDDLEKEILDAIEYRYQQEVKEADGSADKIIAAEKRKKEALDAIKAPLSKLTTARKEETSKATASGQNKFEDDLTGLKLKSEKDLADGKEKIQLELNAKYKKLLDEQVGNEENTNKIKEQMAQEQADLEQKLSDETTQKLVENAISVARQGVEALSNIFSSQNQQEEEQLRKDEDANNKKKDNLKKQLDSKKITQKQYDDTIARMDLEMDKKKRKLEHDQAVRAKEIALFNALINVAVAVAGALATPPGPGGIVMSIIAAALGAIQVGLILAEKVPQAAMGRYDVMDKVMAETSGMSKKKTDSRYNVIGEKDGRSYTDVPFVKSFTGMIDKPMLVGETGKEVVIDPYTTRNLQMNYPDVIQAIYQARVPQRAAGQYPGISTSSSQQIIAPVFSFPPELTEAFKSFNEQAKKGFMARMSYDYMKDEMDKVDQIITDVKK